LNALKKWIRDVSGPDVSLKNTRVMVTCAMLLAVEVILNSTISIYIMPYLRITFGFLAVALCARLFGPLPAMAISALSDFLVLMLQGKGGYYFPGFTLTALLEGLVYGLAFYKKDVKLSNVLIAQAVVALALHIGLNTLWITMTQGKGFVAILPARALANLVEYAIYVPLLLGALRLLERQFRRA
jgi:ECF transporter S component (folate family)